MRSLAIGLLFLLLTIGPFPRAATAAIIGIDENNIEFRHNGGFGGPVTEVKTSSSFTLPGSNPPVQFENTIFGTGDDQSQAAGGTGHFFRPDRAAIFLRPGTGVSQFNPSGTGSPATLIVEFDDQAFATDAAGLGPVISFINITIAGNVGAGGFARFVMNLDVGHARFNREFISSDPGPFQHTFAEGVPTVGFGPFESIEIEGTFVFTAANDNGPTSISFLESSLNMEPTTVIPEPSSIALLGMGGLTLLGYGWRRRRKAQVSA